MERIFFAICALFLFCLNVNCETNFREESVTQLLNPIDSFDTRTWENRYFIDDDHHVAGGPIFIYVGGMDVYNMLPRMNNSHFLEMGEELGAVLIFTEHRFFSDHSRPTANVSIANLQHLNTRAVIADVANLIVQLKVRYGDVPVIAHGNDQGAAIAIWTRQQYPDLIDGVWATSPSLLGIRDMGEYLVVLGESIRKVGGDDCYKDLEQAYAYMASFYDQGYLSTLEELFNTCEPFTPNYPEHEHTFYEQIMMGLTGYFRNGHTTAIQNFCDHLSEADDPMTGYANFRRERLTSDCLVIDTQRHLTPSLSELWETEGAIRLYMYRACTTFGWMRATTRVNQPFGNRLPVEAFDVQCQFLFGDSFTSANIDQMIDNHNRQFGGTSPNVTRVYITDGELDPFQVIGVLEPFGPLVYVDIIPNFTAHAETQHSSLVTDDDVRRVQARARELIELWILESMMNKGMMEK